MEMALLRKFAEANLKIAQGLAATGKMRPVLVADTMFAAVPDYGDPRAKETLREIMSEMLKKSEATYYAFIMEAWLGEATKKEYEGGYLPSEDPKRKEGIILSCATKDGDRLVLVCEIIRIDGVVTFGEPEVLPAVGELLELLGSNGTMH